MRIEQLSAKYELQPRWVHFPLHPEIPAEGTDLAAFYASRGSSIEQANEKMSLLAAEEGLEWGFRTRAYNSRLAQELAVWAESQPGGDKIHQVLFEQYFVRGANLANPEVLIAAAEEIGLDGDEAREALETRAFSDAVDRHWSESQQIGTTGVPTFVYAGRGVVGAQPLEVLERLIEAGRQEE